MVRSRAEKLFDLYANNLSIIKKDARIQVNPDIPDIVFCPLCADAKWYFFTRDDLKTRKITEEHVPPQKLGGKVRTLTCKSCNNNQGSQLEKQLMDMLDLKDFFSGQHNLTKDAKVIVNNDTQITASFGFSEKGWIVNPQLHRNNPKNLEAVQNSLTKQGLKTVNVSFKGPDFNSSDSALLRIAYLWAFSIYGYSLIVHPVFDAIRNQIRNPNNRVLPELGIIRQGIPDSILGVHLITEPKELRSLIVFLKLVSKQKAARTFGVILPGPANNGLNVYNNLVPYRGAFIPLKIQRLIQNFDFNRYPFAIYDIWSEL